MANKIDANRAAELLADFQERHCGTFGSAPSGVVLDLRQERLVVEDVGDGRPCGDGPTLSGPRTRKCSPQ